MLPTKFLQHCSKETKIQSQIFKATDRTAKQCNLCYLHAICDLKQKQNGIRVKYNRSA